MATERAVLCGPVADGNFPVADTRPLRLCLWGRARNVHLTIEDVRRAIWRDVPLVFLDLLDIATCVYCADQVIPRGGLTDPGFGQGWRRRLFFRVPVREPDLWRSPEVCSQLASTLSFLSEDEYLFEFEPLRDGPTWQTYLDLSSDPGEGDPTEVMLFSGGLDSLGGAVQAAVTEKRRALLVSHRATPKLSPRLRTLARELARHAKDAPPALVPVRINKDKRLSHEHTQRSRSFLYASLGATLAVMLGLNRFYFYENGVVSLNLPPSAQVVGARATRTTHPRALVDFSRLFTLLTGKPFVVENRFQWKTKADVVRLIAEAGCRDLIRHTTSCTRTWEATLEHPYCGTCSQCIDRRFAVLAAGEGEADPAAQYRVDLLTGPREDENPRTMLAAYVEMATRIEKMHPLDFFSLYGEASRALRYAGTDPEAVALQVFNLYRQHAREVTTVVDGATARFSSAIRRRELPPSCLVRLVCEAGGSEAQPPAQGRRARPLGENVFRRKGAAWEVRFAGGKEFILLPSKGAAYLHILLSNPGVPVSASDLACRLARNREQFALGGAGEATDREALTAYRVRLAELEEELAEAKKNNDAGRHEQLAAEKQLLLEEIGRSTGLGGRLRKAKDQRDRVRQAVGNAIHRAVRDIAEYDPKLAAHLAPPRLRCGMNPCYTPGQEVEWET
jgi:hypothetical protein